MDDHCLDLVVVGAGWNGLCMARTYHEAFPDAEIKVLDCADSVGGCWANEHVYDGLRTNNLLGSYEFSDFPMTTELTGARPEEHISGHGVHRYFSAAVRYFDLEQFLNLGCKVESARLHDDGRWCLKVVRGPSTVASTIFTKKLVMATGLTSEPSMPSFVGQDLFTGAILHSKELKRLDDRLARSKKVVVVGANKSAFDVCYGVAQRSGEAHMLIRPSRGGPSWVWPRRIRFAGFRTSLSKLSLTRVWSIFDPWPFGEMSSVRRTLRRILHSSTLGRCLTTAFWIVLGNCARRHNRYSSHKGTALLEPWSSTYWMGNSLSINNYPNDWFDHARAGNVVVHHAEVTSVCERDVMTTEGTLQDVDAIVCCTGWKHLPSIRFEPSISEISGSIAAHEIDFIMAARGQILQDTPALRYRARDLPLLNSDKSAQIDDVDATYRLYRGLVPRQPSSMLARNLAFIGLDFSLHTVLLAQAQALWITAFFSDRIDHLQDDNVDYDRVAREAILLSEYEKLRRPSSAGGSGEKFPDLVFDSLPYVGLLLNDLGLKPQRKQTWFQELFSAYSLQDYRGLVEEWKLRLQRKGS
ncbi:FAD-dependent monooxygenase DEP4 [Fulvia fulva]|uniref:FAD-dependent monooxygenase DEP4 n=1 Tax=Passalora fulva TaxID=5499 RepID=A0A9Q8P6X7_PASFU|nr:FAD-dependent monooxygenase DEP4 [Fulvia fulva]KAK4629684.1 FAD-dependent monooxygenase DEP4 [Fulvia fulva]KAK4630667.1 FAD-dependent monooxygenase DEP4 [Fulvia fulva]UJO15421.1 FAD-dependent monooxygenase DEP4 [Fulvia fulva]WPV13033.1 FAD-dependent monooxygenase DEP4 [Fulvia fulva]WPV27694.1 FAD-dependent monooxygenase DEP4 [Fulvia fulva]